MSPRTETAGVRVDFHVPDTTRLKQLAADLSQEIDTVVRQISPTPPHRPEGVKQAEDPGEACPREDSRVCACCVRWRHAAQDLCRESDAGTDVLTYARLGHLVRESAEDAASFGATSAEVLTRAADVLQGAAPIRESDRTLEQIAAAIPREYGAGNMAEMVERMATDLAALRQALEPFATAYFTEVYGYGGRSLKATFRPEEVERAKALHYGPSPCARPEQEGEKP